MGINESNISKCSIWGVNLLIFVVLGTHELPFTRLLNEVERLVDKGVLNNDIIVQAGHTPFESDNMTIYKFVTYEQMDQLYEQADLIITHAGTGSVITGLKKGKVVIAVPRLKKYGEHNDDHQLQLLNAFVEQGHILAWQDGESLEAKIVEAKFFNPKPFLSGRERLFSILDDFIQH